MVKVGEIAPDFALFGTGGAFNLYETLVHKAVLLIFYPKDNTAG